MNKEPIIEFDHLTKYYGAHIGIRDLNFRIEKGEIFGFLGPNGAGKTTTIRLMLDLIKPTEGSIKIFSKNIATHSYEIRKRLGYLPGHFDPYDKMTGNEFLKFTRSIRNISEPVPNKYFDRFELSKKDLTKKIRAYSQGMKQKLGIIHALAHSPELIILDEPSTGLDPLMQEALYEILLEMHQDGCTIFFSSHNLPEVEKICQKVAIIRTGELVGFESLESLRKRKQKKLRIVYNHLPDSPPKLKNAQFLQKVVDGFEYVVDGNIRELLREISHLNLSDIVFPEPNLEDIFLGYYDQLDKTGTNES